MYWSNSNKHRILNILHSLSLSISCLIPESNPKPNFMIFLSQICKICFKSITQIVTCLDVNHNIFPIYFLFPCFPLWTPRLVDFNLRILFKPHSARSAAIRCSSAREKGFPSYSKNSSHPSQGTEGKIRKYDECVSPFPTPMSYQCRVFAWNANNATRMVPRMKPRRQYRWDKMRDWKIDNSTVR